MDNFGAGLAAPGLAAGAKAVQGAAGQGQGAINSFNPTDIAGTQRQQFTNLKSQQLGAGGPQTGTDYMNLYSQQVAKNPTFQGYYNQGNQMYNVPQLTQQAAQLQGEQAAIPSTDTGMARGFDYSAPQLQNKINWDQMYINPQTQMATQQAQAAQGLAQQYAGYGMQQNQQNLLPVQSYAPILQQAMQAQATGWTQAAQQQFAGLQAKMQSGVQLSQTEMQQYTQLAQAQANYSAQIAQAQAGIQEANIKNQFQNVSPGSNLVNTFAKSIINPGTLTQQTGAATYG